MIDHEPDELFDRLVRLPGSDAASVARSYVDDINADESADFAQRMVYLDMFVTRLNAAIARRDMDQEATRH